PGFVLLRFFDIEKVFPIRNQETLSDKEPGNSMVERAVILSTGDELTTGKVVDTNSSAIADRLFAVGVEVAAVLTVSDDRQKLHWALRQGSELGDVMIGTGGLGPTA